MTWEGVPWAVGGGAVIEVETLRTLAYQAISGREGAVGTNDCAVQQLAVPGGSVRVMPGTVGILNRAAGVDGGQQAYVVRNPDEDVVAIAATGSGGPRTDLVAVVIEDPQYPGQPDPADVATGPYARTRVYQGVGAGVTTLEQVDPGQTGYALARITLPASTATVLTAHITNLRKSKAPQQQSGNSVANTDGAGQRTIAFPSAFETAPVVVAAGGNNEDVYVVPGSITTTGFVAIFRRRNNTIGADPHPLLVSAATRIYWIATVGTL